MVEKVPEYFIMLYDASPTARPGHDTYCMVNSVHDVGALKDIGTHTRI